MVAGVPAGVRRARRAAADDPPRAAGLRAGRTDRVLAIIASRPGRQAPLAVAERDAVATGAAFRDLFAEALVAVDRLRSEQPDRDLNESVIDELLEVFARRGLQQVPNSGKLDPRLHEVIETVDPSDEHPAGHIVYVEREGFALGERLLRPARVVVAAEAAQVDE